jgi:hypothetical protein
MKYLGFHLKANDSFKGWLWLFEQIEKKINRWCNRGISIGGRLTLSKTVIEATPIFWMSMTYIPEGSSTKSRRFVSYIYGQGKETKEVPP